MLLLKYDFNNIDKTHLRKATNICKPALINTSKRYMHRARPIVHGAVPRYSSRIPMLTRQHTTTVVKMKKKSNAANDLASDDSGIHKHALKEVCQDNTCETRKCPQICAPIKQVYTKGFFTHKPIAGKYCRYVSDVDANNKQDTQYYVKNTDKNKTANGQQVQAYYQNKEMTPDAKMTNYIKDPNVADKIDE